MRYNNIIIIKDTLKVLINWIYKKVDYIIKADSFGIMDFLS